MDANLKGALKFINLSYKAFEHKGIHLSKEKVKSILEYGISKGYETTNELTDKEIDDILLKFEEKPKSISKKLI